MTMKPPKPKLNRQILDEASEWFVDFRVGDVDSQSRERFDCGSASRPSTFARTWRLRTPTWCSPR